MSTHTLIKKALRAFLTHAGPADRIPIHCVWFSHDAQVIVATDGRTLLMRHGDSADPRQERSGTRVSLAALQQALRVCAGRQQIVVDANTAQVTIGAIRIDGALPSDVRYPPYWRILPPQAQKGGCCTVALDAYYVARMMAAVQSPRVARGAVTLTLGITELDPVTITAEGLASVDEQAWIGAIMPMHK